MTGVAGETPGGGSSWPPVSVVMPVRDEAATLEASVAAVRAQEYPGPVEVVLAVGPSGDGTEEVARRLAEADAAVMVAENPDGRTSAGLNAGLAASSGAVVARVDGHAELSAGYLRRAVELLEETGADNVGGVQQAVGETPFEEAVAAAMTSRFGTGDAKFHYGGAPGPTDTVYLGVFRREALERLGGFDESLVRNQDYELNWRIRDSGGTVFFHPDLRVRYRPRSSLGALARQYFEYGQWKREVLHRHPRSLRWRHLVPPAALAAVAAGSAAAVLDRRWLVLPGGYAVSLVAASLAASPAAGRASPGARARLPVVFAAMHLSWGAGFLVGARRARATARRP